MEYEFTDNAQVRAPRILGPDKFPYDWYFSEGYEKFTNVATGESVTPSTRAAACVTFASLTMGMAPSPATSPTRAMASCTPTTAKCSSAARKCSAYSVVYDYNGTSSDPSDDVVGRPTIPQAGGQQRYDFCAVVVVGAIG